MAKFNSAEAYSHLFEKMTNVENLMMKTTKMLRESLSTGKEHHLLIRHGIEGYRDRIIREFKLRENTYPKEKLYALVRQDKSLRYPHRKILSFLIEQYDYTEKRFCEVHFSRIVKECRIGKNNARQYFEFLLDKGLIETRSDGYRRFYWVTVDARR